MTQDKKAQRKERVLHTRVSEKLDEELREKAAGLGVSVSNLVRNILLNTVEMVEDIVADSSSVVRAAGKEKSAAVDAKAEAPPDPEVVGWQELRLNLNALCSECNEILAKGSSAFMAVFTKPAAPLFRCHACVSELGDSAESPENDSEEER